MRQSPYKSSKKPLSDSGSLQDVAIVRREVDDAQNQTGSVHHDSKAKSPSGQIFHSPLPTPPLPPGFAKEGKGELLDETLKRPPEQRDSRQTGGPATLPSPSPTGLRQPLEPESSPSTESLVYVPPPSPFTPILMSAPPCPGANPSSIIVTLETCTISYKTTVTTLCSKPSFLANYLSPLTRSRTTSQPPSAYPSSQELIPTFLPSTSLHIFLDRPSAPRVSLINISRHRQSGN